MRRFWLFATIVIAGAVTTWLWSRQPASLAMQRIAGNLWVMTGPSDGNTAVFVRADGVVLVDTRSDGNGQRILDLVRAVTDKPVTHILNTHTHYDHVGSNAFFPAAVEVVAQENTAGQMMAMDAFSRPETRHGVPDRTFRDSLTLFSGPEEIELRYFGAAHTNGDAFIVFRAAGVMHAGDTFPGVNAVAENGGSESEYASTMGRAAAGITGVHTVIPGHGGLATWQAFVANAEAIRRR